MNCAEPLDDDFKAHYGLTEFRRKTRRGAERTGHAGPQSAPHGQHPREQEGKICFQTGPRTCGAQTEVLKLLLNAEAVEIHGDVHPRKAQLPTVRTELGDLYLPLEGLIDVEAEKARLKKELEEAETELAKVQQKLNNPAFTQKVPPNVLANIKTWPSGSPRRSTSWRRLRLCKADLVLEGRVIRVPDSIPETKIGDSNNSPFRWKTVSFSQLRSHQPLNYEISVGFRGGCEVAPVTR